VEDMDGQARLLGDILYPCLDSDDNASISDCEDRGSSKISLRDHPDGPLLPLP